MDAEVTYNPELGAWFLVEDWALWCREGDWEVTVPAGFRFDLASIPRLLWPVVGPFELSIDAPLFHDACYQYGGFCRGAGLIPRRNCLPAGRRTCGSVA